MSGKAGQGYYIVGIGHHVHLFVIWLNQHSFMLNILPVEVIWLVPSKYILNHIARGDECNVLLGSKDVNMETAPHLLHHIRRLLLRKQ